MDSVDAIIWVMKHLFGGHSISFIISTFEYINNKNIIKEWKNEVFFFFSIYGERLYSFCSSSGKESMSFKCEFLQMKVIWKNLSMKFIRFFCFRLTNDIVFKNIHCLIWKYIFKTNWLLTQYHTPWFATYE